MSAHDWLELAAPYALGALDPEELSSFEAHLAECETCRREVRELREVAGALAYAAPPAEPPARLRQRILDEARRVRPLPRPARVAAPVPWLAAAASVVLAVTAGVAYWRGRGERLALERSYAEARSALAARDSVLARRDSLVSALFGPELRTAALAATGAPPSARLFWNPEKNVVVVVAFNLPPAAPGRTYQLWGIPRGQRPVSLGTFNTAPEGRATLALDVPAGIELELSAVTEEPAGGSPQPTSTPFLVGPWAGGG
ncbi:MAG: anti-sigma factor [Gemmatimonadetes bacterium]|nr:anti-sigma factor [Gemmatimonadota bacterium]